MTFPSVDRDRLMLLLSVNACPEFVLIPVGLQIKVKKIEGFCVRTFRASSLYVTSIASRYYMPLSFTYVVLETLLDCFTAI